MRDIEAADLKIKQAQLSSDITDKEQVIDGALLLCPIQGSFGA
jgi:hypothetical protein